MGEVLQSELGVKYFPTHNIHQNYYELLRKTLYWKQVRLDYPTPKSATPGQASLTPSGKRRGRPPKYVVEERQQQAAAAAAGQPTSLQQQQQQQQQQASSSSSNTATGDAHYSTGEEKETRSHDKRPTHAKSQFPYPYRLTVT